MRTHTSGENRQPSQRPDRPRMSGRIETVLSTFDVTPKVPRYPTLGAAEEGREDRGLGWAAGSPLGGSARRSAAGWGFMPGLPCPANPPARVPTLCPAASGFKQGKKGSSRGLVPGANVETVVCSPRWRISSVARAEGLLLLHGLESNPGSSLQTEEEAGLP